MATHTNVLAWKIPGTEEPGGLLSMGSHIITHSPLFTSDFFFYCLILVVLGLCCCTGFLRVVASRGSSVVAVHGLLIAVASLVAERVL